MDNLRFFGLAVGMFAAVFFGMKWFLTVQPLQPDARVPTFQRYDPDSPRAQLESSSIGDDDPTRDRLRHEVLDYAKALSDDPCNKTLKKHYVQAVNDYARAWLSIVPCFATLSCRSADSKNLDRATQAFGSPLDRRVREAMQQLHAKRIFKLGDFPNDDSLLVAYLANDGVLSTLAAKTMPNGPVNAQSDARQQPSFADVQSQLVDGTVQPACGD
jgi:hypothetical protein